MSNELLIVAIIGALVVICYYYYTTRSKCVKQYKNATNQISIAAANMYEWWYALLTANSITSAEPVSTDLIELTALPLLNGWFMTDEDAIERYKIASKIFNKFAKDSNDSSTPGVKLALNSKNQQTYTNMIGTIFKGAVELSTAVKQCGI